MTEAPPSNPDAIGSLIDAETRRHLRDLAPGPVAAAFAATLASAAAVFAIALGTAHPLGILAAFVLAIAVQTHMAVLMHEGALGTANMQLGARRV